MPEDQEVCAFNNYCDRTVFNGVVINIFNLRLDNYMNYSYQGCFSSLGVIMMRFKSAIVVAVLSGIFSGVAVSEDTKTSKRAKGSLDFTRREGQLSEWLVDLEKDGFIKVGEYDSMSFHMKVDSVDLLGSVPLSSTLSGLSFVPVDVSDSLLSDAKYLGHKAGEAAGSPVKNRFSRYYKHEGLGFIELEEILYSEGDPRLYPGRFLNYKVGDVNSAYVVLRGPTGLSKATLVWAKGNRKFSINVGSVEVDLDVLKREIFTLAGSL